MMPARYSRGRAETTKTSGIRMPRPGSHLPAGTSFAVVTGLSLRPAIYEIVFAIADTPLTRINAAARMPSFARAQADLFALWLHINPGLRAGHERRADPFVIGHLAGIGDGKLLPGNEKKRAKRPAKAKAAHPEVSGFVVVTVKRTITPPPAAW
jgi:hypothetical protein